MHAGRVSIHARVKRATVDFEGDVGWRCVSIHARVKRATPRTIAQTLGGSCFNPRPREAGDRIDGANLAEAREFQSTPA